MALWADMCQLQAIVDVQICTLIRSGIVAGNCPVAGHSPAGATLRFVDGSLATCKPPGSVASRGKLWGLLSCQCQTVNGR